MFSGASKQLAGCGGAVLTAVLGEGRVSAELPSPRRSRCAYTTVIYYALYKVMYIY